jgi:hypothetical protein
VKPEVRLTIELNSLKFLMDTSNYTEQTNKQEDVARMKVVKEEEARSGKLSTDSVNS